MRSPTPPSAARAACRGGGGGVMRPSIKPWLRSAESTSVSAVLRLVLRRLHRRLPPCRCAGARLSRSLSRSLCHFILLLCSPIPPSSDDIYADVCLSPPAKQALQLARMLRHEPAHGAAWRHMLRGARDAGQTLASTRVVAADISQHSAAPLPPPLSQTRRQVRPLHRQRDRSLFEPARCAGRAARQRERRAAGALDRLHAGHPVPQVGRVGLLVWRQLQLLAGLAWPAEKPRCAGQHHLRHVLTFAAPL